MEALRDALIGVVLALVFAWLWRSAANEKVTVEPDRKIFPPTRAIRIVVFLGGIVFTALTIFSFVMARKPQEWWVPYLFMGFVLLAVFAYPPVLSIEVDGVASRAWFGREKKIRWEDIASLHFNSQSKQFTVRGRDGSKISHAGFNADPQTFQNEVWRRGRLPLKVAQPGVWKTKTVEVSYPERES